MLLTNRNGRIVQVDNEVRRQQRTVRRLRAWWRSLDGFVPRRRGMPGAWMVTLTYRHNVAWRPEHVTDFIRKVRHDTKVTGYAWVAAIQPGTGRVHYHIIFVGPRPAWVSNRWGHGRTQTRPAWSVGYLLKYLWSDEVRGLPKGCRRFGAAVNARVLCGEALWVFRLAILPKWVASVCEVMGGLARREGRDWVCSCGIVLRNEWEPL